MRFDIAIASSISRAVSSTRTRLREPKGSGAVGLHVLSLQLFVWAEKAVGYQTGSEKDEGIRRITAELRT